MINAIKIERMHKYKLNSPIRVYVFILLGYLIQLSYLPEEYPVFKYLIFLFYGIGYVFGTLQLFSQKWSRHAQIWSLLLMFIGFSVFILNDNIGMEARLTVFNLVWVLICSKGIDLDKTIRADLKIRIVFTAILYVMCCTGLLTNVTAYRDYGRIRYAWGYSHPNTAGSVYFLIVLYIAYLRRDKLSIKDLIFQLAVAYMTYVIPNSQTGTIGIIMVSLYTIYYQFTVRILKRNKERLLYALRRVLIASPIIIVIMVFVLSYIYNPSNQTMAFINKLFTSRLEQGSKILDFYRPTLFGNNIMRMSWNDVLEARINTAVVGSDIMYVYIYTTFGITTLAMYIFILVENLKNSLQQNLCLTYFIVVLAVIACIENPYINVGSNIFLLHFSAFLYRNRTMIIEPDRRLTISWRIVRVRK